MTAYPGRTFTPVASSSSGRDRPYPRAGLHEEWKAAHLRYNEGIQGWLGKQEPFFVRQHPSESDSCGRCKVPVECQ